MDPNHPGYGEIVLVEVFSDVICPWCYLGKHRFEAALAAFPGRRSVEVAWRAFQLDPGAPTQPTPMLDAYARKFGGPERAGRGIERLANEASADGAGEIRADIARAADLDVLGVPTFVFEGRFAVPGAQEPETFLRILQRIAERGAREPLTS